jgi:hypothetical protein
MRRKQEARIAPPCESSAVQSTNGSWCDAGRFRLYGWDSRSKIWHGPNELGDCIVPDKRLLRALRAALGRSWYGRVRCSRAGEVAGRFFVLAQDLSDCAIAMIYCDESKTGPTEIIAVVPVGRRSRLRDEFAFEFLAFARFLGLLSAGDELEVHEALVAALTSREDGESIVFSISSAIWPGELDPTLSRCVEKLALTLGQWLAEPAASSERSSHRAIPSL